MAHPVSILSVSSYKLSYMSGFTSALISFEFGGDIKGYTVNLLGVSHDTGTLLDSYYKSVTELASLTVSEAAALTVDSVRYIEEGVDIITQVDAVELSSEGDNRINIYGLGADDVWTSYDEGS